MLRVLLTRRWVTALVLALAFAVAAVLLGSWQYSRHQEAVTGRDRVEAHYESEPVPLQQVLPPGGTVSTEQYWPRGAGSRPIPAPAPAAGAQPALPGQLRVRGAGAAAARHRRAAAGRPGVGGQAGLDDPGEAAEQTGLRTYDGYLVVGEAGSPHP